ncbi:DNA polymerase III subunit delta' [Inhella crocodyli]|uniref:DNA polymerase III subunit delta' n=1 Tax=Inhella crocodyli TaxID=2499851 RepID=UPI0013E3EACF|nr:DNA polymerase III subunit delta' [Inhella crocodyli]
MSAVARPPWVERALREALQIQRSHALLIAGPSGLGQFELAQALMAAWLCEDHAPGSPACGHCAACHLVGQRSHPDATWLLPAARRVALGWEPVEESSSKAKPSQEIRIDEVRAVLGFAQSTPARGVAKVIGVFPAEAMNTIAANALLKTLEEPGGVLRFAIATEALDELLPTVRSRCQILPLRMPPREEAAAWLEAEGVKDAAALLTLAGGQVLRAQAWASAGWDVSKLHALPRAVAQGDLGAWSAATPAQLIDLLQRLVHDLLAVVAGAPAHYFAGVALPKVRHAAPLQRWAASLREARQRSDHPLQWALWLEALALEGQHALRAACQPINSAA